MEVVISSSSSPSSISGETLGRRSIPAPPPPPPSPSIGGPSSKKKIRNGSSSSSSNIIDKEGFGRPCPFCDESPIPHLPSHLLSAHPHRSSSSSSSLLEDANLLLTVGVRSGIPCSPSGLCEEVLLEEDEEATPVNLSLRPSSRSLSKGSSSSDEGCVKGSGSGRKRRKQTQVPEVNKDERYWARRLKNNEAAKRSRDMRIMRERVIFEENARLERLSGELRGELERVSMDNKELTLKMGLILEENSRLKALLGLFQTSKAVVNHNNNNNHLECLSNNNNNHQQLNNNNICDLMSPTTNSSSSSSRGTSLPSSKGKPLMKNDEQETSSS